MMRFILVTLRCLIFRCRPWHNLERHGVVWVCCRCGRPVVAPPRKKALR